MLRLQHLCAHAVDVFQKLHARFAIRFFGVLRARRKLFIADVIDAAACAGHKLRKDEVDAFRHGFARTEVAV